MPLPKPPATKAAILSAVDFESQAAPRADRKAGRSRPQAVAGASLDLFDGGAPVAAPRAGGARTPAPAAAPVTALVTAPAPAPRQGSSGMPTKQVSLAAPPPPAAAPKTRGRKARGEGPAKLFVLDTNVLMHDPMSLFRFEEHDVFLPMITLEELDGHKKGMSEVARNARQVSREMDALATSTNPDGSLDPAVGIPLSKTGHKDAGGNLFFQTMLLDVQLPAGLPQGKADNQILGVVKSLREAESLKPKGREVVLVSKDINMRVKARALGLAAEDYFNDKVLEDSDLLYTGMQELPADFWEKHSKGVESWQQGGAT